MAVSARSLVTYPAAFAVAAWTVVGLTLMINHYGQPDVDPMVSHDSCSNVAQANGDGENPATWSEYEWYRYITCVEDTGDIQRAAGVASIAAKHYPTSEALVNTAGILFLKVDDYPRAERVLMDGAQSVQTTSGTLHNNLAWASLYTGNYNTAMLRNWYRRALSHNPNSCELLHTGLMVEWRSITEERAPFQVGERISDFSGLFDRYLNCSERTTSDRNLVTAEYFTALVAAESVDQALGVTFNTEFNRALVDIAPEVKDLEAQGLRAESVICNEIPTTINRTSCSKWVKAALAH